jgi:hypothetical protein
MPNGIARAQQFPDGPDVSGELGMRGRVDDVELRMRHWITLPNWAGWISSAPRCGKRVRHRPFPNKLKPEFLADHTSKAQTNRL